MAGRKRGSPEDIGCKSRRADELTAAGKTGEEIAAELGVSAAAKRRAVDMLKGVLRMSERLACMAVGLAAPPIDGSRWRRPPSIRAPRCGPGCTPTPPSIRVMGSWACLGGVALRRAPWVR
jgi:hypothetical protein